MIYMFDMDGTLTPARKPMEEDFAKCFLPWLQKNKAFIVTGSDIAKVLEQLPSDVVNAFREYTAPWAMTCGGKEILFITMILFPNRNCSLIWKTIA